MFVSSRTRTRYQDCSPRPIAYYRDFLDDVADQSGRTMEDGRVFSACWLALRCQATADRFKA
jgi:hypothetical protein